MRSLVLLLCVVGCAPSEDAGLDLLASTGAARTDVDALRDTVRALRTATTFDERMSIARRFMNDTAYSGGFPLVEPRRLAFAFLDERVHAVSVAGDFNGWSASAGTMTAAVAGFPFYYRVVNTDGRSLAGSRYKIVRDGREWLADPAARSFEFDGYGEISFVQPPLDRSHLERWPDFGVGSAVLERSLQVYVPAGAGPFPVIYANDGQNLWPGGWRMKDAADAAIADGVHPFLVVAVPNSPERFDEYTHVADDIGFVTGGAADSYLGFLVDAVKPFVDARYPTRPGREDTAILGSSLGGLVSLYAGWRYPDVFGAAASFSGTVGWGSIGVSEATVVDFYADHPAEVSLYVDSGGGPGTGCVDSDGDGLHDDGNGNDNYCENVDFVAAARASGLDVVYRYTRDASHNEAAWALRLPGALRDWFPR
jgi:hypothetical protein